jgi:translocation and assembly module TamB
VTEERVKLTALEATVFGGTISGSLDYPFAPEKAGAFEVSFKGVDAAAMAAFVPDFPVRLTGAVSGKVAGSLPAAKDEPGRVGNLDVDLTAPRLTVQGIPAERLVGKVAVKGGNFDYALEGRTLGGSFEVKGRYPGRKKEPPAKDDRGTLRVTDIDLSQLAGALGSDTLRPLGGRVDVTFDYANDLSSGSGRVLIRGLAWGTADASPEIVGVLLLRDGFLELRDLGGTLARGQLRGRARVSLEDPDRNFVAVVLERADARRLLAPVPDLAGFLDGNVSVELRARFGRAIHGSGSVTLSRGAVGGSDVGEIRVPFDFSTAPGGYGRFVVREATTRSGSGRTTGAVTVTWGPGAGATVQGHARFIDLPLRAVSPALGETAYLGAGRITGRFDVSGTNVRSANDLTGTLVASLNNTSVKEVPLLRQATPFLNPIGVTKPFQSGDIRGTLARGVFRVQRLALANPSAQVFAEGSITLEGRLDLDVVAHTGTIGPDVRGLRAFGLRLPTLGPVPLTLIRDVSDFLSNRTVRLTISGTAANPVVRVNTGALLTQEAVRFFLTRYVLPSELAAGIGLGTFGGGASGSNGTNR